MTELGDTATSRSGGMRREAAFIAAVYTISWGLLLSASGRYWDDWAALDLGAAASSAWSRQQGLFWQLDLLELLSALPGTERIGHILVFFAYLACALILHALLGRVGGLSRQARVLLPALFAVFPVNASRYALATLMYAVSLLVFMVGWWMIAVDVKAPSITRRVAAAALLLFSLLSMGSLMVFIAVIPMYLAWVYVRAREGHPELRTMLMRYGFLIGLPIVALFVRSMALQPSGIYANYNSLSLGGAMRAAGMLPTAFQTSILEPVVRAFGSNLLLVVLGGLACYSVALLLLATTGEGSKTSWIEPVAMLGSGIVVFVLAAFPYLAVDKMPMLGGWESRHQILVPFAGALVVYAGVSLVVRLLALEERAAVLITSLLLSAFVFANLFASFDLQAEWYKQVSLMQRMAESEEMERGRHFIFTDLAADLNAAKPEYTAYEYNGMMRMAMGDATRFGVDANGIAFFDPLLMRQHQQYNCWEYEPTPVRYGVTITHGEQDVTRTRAVLGLMWREVFAPDEFRERVADVVRIEVERLPDAE
ncbi:MAG: hypothetical protein WBJ62_02375 [Coriobacteriia bacterium]